MTVARFYLRAHHNIEPGKIRVRRCVWGSGRHVRIGHCVLRLLYMHPAAIFVLLYGAEVLLLLHLA